MSKTNSVLERLEKDVEGFTGISANDLRDFPTCVLEAARKRRNSYYKQPLRATIDRISSFRCKDKQRFSTRKRMSKENKLYLIALRTIDHRNKTCHCYK